MASDKCIIHSRQNISKLHPAVNQLRRVNTFSNDIYQELPKRCSSCNGNKGLKSIDLDILRQMCEDIILSLSSTLKFRFSSNMSNLVLESFKIITATDGCIVHNSKYQSKFNNAINLIRRGKKYKNSIYHELSKRCCSCNGKKGLNVIDLNVLINICDGISLDKSFETIKLSFEPETDSRECHRRISRFIGKK
ncbi:unnamed protein product, partial [Adineta steineri]